MTSTEFKPRVLARIPGCADPVTEVIPEFLVFFETLEALEKVRSVPGVLKIHPAQKAVQCRGGTVEEVILMFEKLLDEPAIGVLLLAMTRQAYDYVDILDTGTDSDRLVPLLDAAEKVEGALQLTIIYKEALDFQRVIAPANLVLPFDMLNYSKQISGTAKTLALLRQSIDAEKSSEPVTLVLKSLEKETALEVLALVLQKADVERVEVNQVSLG